MLNLLNLFITLAQVGRYLVAERERERDSVCVCVCVCALKKCVGLIYLYFFSPTLLFCGWLFFGETKNFSSTLNKKTKRQKDKKTLFEIGTSRQTDRQTDSELVMLSKRQTEVDRDITIHIFMKTEKSTLYLTYKDRLCIYQKCDRQILWRIIFGK